MKENYLLTMKAEDRPGLLHLITGVLNRKLVAIISLTASACICKSIALIDEEPWWKDKLWDNINYLKSGLAGLGFDMGNSAAAIVPVMTGNPNLNAEVCHLLMEAGVYTNQIGYPAVPKKRARIRMSIMATHTREQMDKVLNAFEWVDRKLHITNKSKTNNIYDNTKKETQKMGQ